MTRKNANPPTKSQQQHAQKVTHRRSDGRFKPAPTKPLPATITEEGKRIRQEAAAQGKPKPAELDQDAGSGFNRDRSDIQQ